MTNIKKIIENYVESENIMDMFALTDMIEEFVDEVSNACPETVKNFVMKLKMYKHPLGTKECAEYAVSKMQNEDGTTGEHWDYETTSKLADKYGITDKPAFYYVLNMKYSDYYEPNKPDTDYIKDSIKFMHDKDGPHDKAERYYRAMNYNC